MKRDIRKLLAQETPDAFIAASPCVEALYWSRGAEVVVTSVRPTMAQRLARLGIDPTNAILCSSLKPDLPAALPILRREIIGNKRRRLRSYANLTPPICR